MTIDEHVTEAIQKRFDNRDWKTFSNYEYENCYEHGRVPLLALKDEYMAVVAYSDKDLEKANRHIRANLSNQRLFIFKADKDGALYWKRKNRVNKDYE